MKPLFPSSALTRKRETASTKLDADFFSLEIEGFVNPRHSQPREAFVKKTDPAEGGAEEV